MMLVGEDFVNYIQRNGHAEYPHTVVCGYDGEIYIVMTTEVYTFITGEVWLFYACEVHTLITGEVYLALDLLDAYLFSMIKRYSI